jgi:hypothetical protein
MSKFFTEPAEPLDVVEDPEHVIEAASPAPIFITEQEVALSTAAAVPLPRTKPIRSAIAAARAMFSSSPAAARPGRRHFPPRRDAFLERAAMAREMHRL